MSDRVKVSLSRSDAEWLVSFLGVFHQIFDDSHLRTLRFEILLALNSGVPTSEIFDKVRKKN